MDTSPEALIGSLDVSIFRGPSQTRPNDRRSLLLTQNLVRHLFGRYHYLEIGSHLGGTLIPHLLDPLCVTILSVDKRPDAQPDERGEVFRYDGNSTARMIETLGPNVPETALLKLATFDGDASALPADVIAHPPDLVFIDGEHTNRAVVSDFLHTYRHAPRTRVFAFHDANLVMDGILNVEAFLSYLGVRHHLLFLPDTVAVLLVGDAVASAPGLARHAFERDSFLDTARDALHAVIAGNVARKTTGTV